MRGLHAAALAATLGLIGCATPYSSTGLTGGYADTKVNERLIKVDFYGNGYIDSNRVQTFALYRCAEVARNAHKAYFVLYDSLGAAARDKRGTLPRVGTLGGKPIAVAFIVPTDEALPGAHEVKDVLSRLGPQVEAVKVRGDKS